MKRLNIITGSILLALSIGAYIIAGGMVARLPTDPLGPGFWPKCLSYALGFFSIILIFQGAFFKKAPDAAPPIDFKSEGFHRVIKLFGVLIIFLAIVYFLGIYIGLLFMVPAAMYLLGERKAKIMIPFSVGTCLFIFVVFKLLLKVPLPAGFLFS